MALPASALDHRSAEPSLVRRRDLHPDAQKGFLYLVAIMDWFSRKVLAWRLSNTMDADFCVTALEEAIARFGRPEIFNTDQGSQFTNFAFTNTLKGADIRISMDGRGRWMDNVFIERLWRSLKYECVYLNAFETGGEARTGDRRRRPGISSARRTSQNSIAKRLYLYAQSSVLGHAGARATSVELRFSSQGLSRLLSLLPTPLQSRPL